MYSFLFHHVASLLLLVWYYRLLSPKSIIFSTNHRTSPSLCLFNPEFSHWYEVSPSPISMCILFSLPRLLLLRFLLCFFKKKLNLQLSTNMYLRMFLINGRFWLGKKKKKRFLIHYWWRIRFVGYSLFCFE